METKGNQKPLSDRELRDLVAGCPLPWTCWRHKATGKAYVVTGRAVIEATLQPAVTCRSAGENFSWVRPVMEFLEKFERVPEGTPAGV